LKKNYLISIFFLFLFAHAFAQKEATHWYFGNNAGLDFSSGTPVADTNGALNTLEGCTTISDVAGNLLFYTDGTTVWNKNHLVMPTGNGLFGDSSSSQSAIIVPKPDDSNIYYIFTVDWSNGDNGLNYYTVDMSLDDGLGDVLGNSNVPSPTQLLTSPTSEKITAVKVKDEEAFWVISTKSDAFYVYKIDNNGIQTTSVPGNSGFSVPQDLRGYLKASPDGKTLVSANMSSGTYIYDFDNATGNVTNERIINLSEESGYGVEFSPLSKKLYISTGNFGNNPPYQEKLFQFSLENGDNINDSRIEIHSSINSRAALQVALDGKIYRAIHNSSSLGVIHNPDGDGLAANYEHNAISLGNKTSRQGLPPFITSFFAALIKTEHLCLGDLTQFSIESNEPIISILWDFGDGSSTSTELNPSHTYATAGSYIINVDVTTAKENKQITQTITIFDIPSVSTPISLYQCDDDTDGFTHFNLDESIELMVNDATDLQILFYQNLNDANDGNKDLVITDHRHFSNNQTSKIYARVENIYGCYTIVTVNLKVSTSTLPDNFMVSIDVCDDDADGDNSNGFTVFDFSQSTQTILAQFSASQNLGITYYETIADGLEEINSLDPNNYQNIIPFTQQLIVRIENKDNNQCLGLGSFVTLKVNPLPEFYLVEEVFLCLNDPLSPVTVTAEKPQDVYTYQWTDSNNINLPNGNTETYNFIEPGNYQLTATRTNTINCSQTRTILVSSSNIATFQSIDVTDAGEHNTIIINVTGEGNYEFALDDGNESYQDSNIFENVASGIHTIFVRDKNGCGTIEKEVSVIGFPNFFTPNGDGFNDTWQIDGISFQPTSLIYIFDRFGKVLAKIDALGKGWDGKYRGKLLPESDYWFKVSLEDGRNFKGHFSLIRR